MTTFINYVTAFWTVIITCSHPINWDNCKNINEWLIPGIQEGIHLYMNPSSIYETEREYLEDINKDKKK